MPAKPPHAVALLASWFFCFAAMTLIAIVDAGLSAWLQGTIYLLAAVLFGLGLADILRYVYFGVRAKYRQGIYYVVAGWVFAGHAYYRIREHRANVAQEESQFTPVVDAVKHYQDVRGRLPATLDEIQDLPSHLPRFRYEPKTETSFLLVFHHDVVVGHEFDSETGTWHDEYLGP